MIGGYIGKILFVNLSEGKLKDEVLDEKLCRKFIGGYGIGARLIYSWQRGGVDPLGSDNILGFMTGPLTGTDVPFGVRLTVVGKSPLTGGWGDSTAGGDFGSYLKFAGYDGIFFSGASEKPVYLFIIEDGKAELRDATHLWRKDTVETEEMLKTELGKGIRVASIGPAAEKLSLMSSVLMSGRRAAGRSGIGAVMGSKKLKAVAVVGRAKVPIASSEEVSKLRKEYVANMKRPVVDMFRTFDTVAIYAHSGDTPVKNWGGVALRDFPTANLISGEKITDSLESRYGCHRCPIACGGHMRVGTQYKYEAGAKKPEYETLAAFGTLCLNDNLESIIMANDICDRYGIDTIETGATIAFAIECYENGIITREDTEGIELTWGNHEAIVAMTRRLAKREGFGNVLADGVKVASERIGKGSDKYAMHVHGQALPMHDPKLNPSYATCYQSDPTPARHMQAGLAHFVENAAMKGAPSGLDVPPLDRYTYTGKGKYEVICRNKNHLLNASGVCYFSQYVLPWDWLDKSLSAVTGWQLSPEEITTMCERISAMRQVFNLREGLSPKDFKLPGRAIGDPPLKDGPTANITVDADTMVSEYYQALDWDPETGKPSKKRLLELGLEDVAKDLWP